MTFILRIIPVILLLSCFSSCTEKDKGLKNFGKEIFKDLNNNDIASLKKKIYRPSIDTNIIESYSSFVEIDSGRIKTDFNERKNDINARHVIYKYKTYRSIDDKIGDHRNSNIWKKDLKLLNVKVDTFSSFIPDKKPEIEVHFSHDSTVYKFQVDDLLKMRNGWRFCSITNSVSEIDVLKYRAKKWKRRYLNNLNGNNKINITRYSWRSKRKSKHFKNFFILLSNDSDYNFTKVHIRITMYEGRGYDKEKILSDTYKVDGIQQGDVTRHEIRELRGFYTGFDIGNEEEWSVECVVEDVSPPPADTPDFDVELSK